MFYLSPINAKKRWKADKCFLYLRKKNFFLTISIETLTFKNALLHIEKKSY